MFLSSLSKPLPKYLRTRVELSLTAMQSVGIRQMLASLCCLEELVPCDTLWLSIQYGQLQHVFL